MTESQPAAPWTASTLLAAEDREDEVAAQPPDHEGHSRRSSKRRPSIIDAGAVTREISESIALVLAATDGWVRTPRLRRTSSDWAESRSKLEAGQVTTEESLWVVIFTMGVAGMRNQVLADMDVEWYVLHFFCFWYVVMASINYSSRFNDNDVFHKVLWAAFTMGMAGQVAFLDHSMRGFCIATIFLYALAAGAHLRVAWHLPATRVFCCYEATKCLAAAGALSAIAAGPPLHSTETNLVHGRMEKDLLWVHALIDPCGALFFVFVVTGKRDRQQRWDVPLNLDYLIRRFEGMHMMIIACSFLFPLGLMGDEFRTSSAACLAVLSGNLFALILKLGIVDRNEHELEPGVLERHAIRQSRPTALAFLITFPLSMLGIAVTGLGFVAAANGEALAITRQLLCFGPALTWLTLALQKGLHRGLVPTVHWTKVAAMLAFALIFLVPIASDLGVDATLLFTVLVETAVVASQILIQKAMTGCIPANWQWRRPRLLVDWQSQEVPRFRSFVASPRPTESPEVVGVSSQEHFFTVLLAVCAFKLNADFRKSQDWQVYVQQLVIFYGVTLSTTRYASRFKDEDAAHKLLWSIYEFLLLLMLVGVAGATVAVFLLLCIGFSGRMAVGIPRVRRFLAFVIVCHGLCAAFAFVALLLPEREARYARWAPATILLLIDWIKVGIDRIARIACVDAPGASPAPSPRLTSGGAFWRLRDVPLNLEYIVARYNGLFMEVLGVAVIVPNAVYPGAYAAHSGYVAACTVLAVILAVCIKMGNFDAEPASFERHAVGRSRWAALLFFSLTELMIFAICAVGTGVPALIDSVGQEGPDARNHFAQGVTSGSALLLWGSLAAVKLLHRPTSRPRMHRAKALFLGLGAAANVLPIAADFGAFATLACQVATAAFIVMSEQLMNACWP